MDINKLINRAKNLIVSPAAEWEIISSENENQNNIIKDYAAPLIILAALTGIIGNFLAPRFFTPGMGYVITTAIFAIIIPLASIFISSYIIDALAPSFGTEKNIKGAFTLVIYASTPAYIASIVGNLHWTLSILSLFGLYSIYLFWVGISPIMKTPEDKKTGYVVVSFIILIAVYLLLGLIISSVLLGSIFMH